MPARKNSPIDPAAVRVAVGAVVGWLTNGSPEPQRSEIAEAVRLSARLLAQLAPGHSVEVRVPPFVAVQCIEGPRHTRGTPSNVFECDPRTWLQLVAGVVPEGEPAVSGSRAAEISRWLPLVQL